MNDNPMIMTRERCEAAEHERLSPRASFSDRTRGRELAVEPDAYRTDFQRDRDRIIHCKAFRRLSHKTQVFLAPEGDHYRTRLTHTLEVAQISRSCARTLRLNEDLAEAVALGHDLGHTPFGHTGEDALSEVLATIRSEWPDAPERFRHNVQSLRIVEHLEYGGKGLNLTWEVRDGLLGHTGGHVPATLEGQIVRIADRIAYVNHDIDDAVRAGVLDESDLPAGAIGVLGSRHAARITTMVEDLIQTSATSPQIEMSPRVWTAMMELRGFLFENVYLSGRAKIEAPQASQVVRSLFLHYLEHPEQLPEEARLVAETDRPQAVIDYVAGMTDRFAVRDFERLFVPQKPVV
jgi:dGTPase